jgi:hypothetical protein
MLKQIFIAVIILLAMSCRDKRFRDEKAISIVKQCIEQHGGKSYDHVDVSFDFRQFRVHLKQNGGNFLYERTSKDSMNSELHDMLTNETFTREVDGKKQDLAQKESDKYREGLNAIAYFALLPYKLSDPAVNLKYSGEITIENKKYDKIAVSFEETGGGNDHQDEFCYWINQSAHTLDYLAYSKGGLRFRKSTKREKVDGVIFQDYENYESEDSTLSIFKFDDAFIAGKVRLLSKIEQQNFTANKSKKL